ncbi:MAG: hypothetical protein GY892_18720 [Shimia sp.]|nr:hypothetical protein [Shimia sp.]
MIREEEREKHDARARVVLRRLKVLSNEEARMAGELLLKGQRIMEIAERLGVSEEEAQGMLEEGAEELRANGVGDSGRSSSPVVSVTDVIASPDFDVPRNDSTNVVSSPLGKAGVFLFVNRGKIGTAPSRPTKVLLTTKFFMQNHMVSHITSTENIFRAVLCRNLLISGDIQRASQHLYRTAWDSA